MINNDSNSDSKSESSKDTNKDMENEPVKNKNNFIIAVLLDVVVTFLISRLSFGFFLFPIPLLVLTYRFKKLSNAVLIQVLTYFATGFWLFYSIFTSKNLLPELLVITGVYVFCSVASFAVIYTALRDFSSSIMRKLVLSSVPVMVAGCICLIKMEFSENESLVAFITNYANMFSQILGNSASVGTDYSEYSKLIIRILKYSLVPLSCFFSIVPVLVSETTCNRYNPQKQEEFAMMKMPRYCLWILLFFWAGFFLSLFFKLPSYVNLVCFALPFSYTLFYALNGESVFLSLIRRKKENFSAGSLLLIVFFVLVIPFVNIVVFAILAVTGIMESILENKVVFR